MDQTKLVKRFRVDKPKRFKLAAIDPSDTCGLDIAKAEAKAMIAVDIERLVDLQQRLYAENRWAILMIFQGMDTAGKDGVIRHVLSGVNPQGCQVHSFKAPSAEELDHDFLWRTNRALPERGRIGIFNRSYYEEVLAVRMHPDYLDRQNLPPRCLTKHIWKQRFDSIREMERHLARNGTVVLKFHLRISKEEQKRRLLERLDDPAKNWKFSMGDVVERRLWDGYMDCYEDMIRHTSTDEAPWYVVPSDNKWFARLVVSAVLVETLERLKLAFPTVEGEALAALRGARQALETEDDPPARRRTVKARGTAKR